MLESATLYKAVLFKILNRKTSYKDSSLTVKLQRNFKNVPVLAKLDRPGIDILTEIDRMDRIRNTLHHEVHEVTVFKHLVYFFIDKITIYIKRKCKVKISLWNKILKLKSGKSYAGRVSPATAGSLQSVQNSD